MKRIQVVSVHHDRPALTLLQVASLRAQDTTFFAEFEIPIPQSIEDWKATIDHE